MSGTLSSIRLAVASNLGDSGMVQHPADSINTSIQEGFAYLCAKTLCLEKSFRFPQIADKVYYDFSSYFPDFIAVSGIWSFTIGRWLIPASRKLFDTWRWDWELMNGEPRWFDPINFRYVAIIPHNSQTTGVFQVFYKAQANTLADNSVIDLPITAIKALEDYATADQFWLDREFKRGIRYFKRFQDNIPVIRKLALRKSDADRINLSAPNDSLPTFAGLGGGGNVWITGETPSGAVDGVNTVFVLSGTPNPANSLLLFLDGLLLYQGTHYSIVGKQVTLNVAPPINIPVSAIRAWYEVN
jgi:hypothetical protein